jgi:hypothetical protein
MRMSPRLKKAAKIALLVAVVIGTGIQFVPVKGLGSNPPGRYNLDAPPDVESILRRSCFDCHSHETRWPWYAKVAPGSWLLARDVRKARSRLNLSEWGKTDEEERQVDKEDMWGEIEAGRMPLSRYLLLNPSARLDDEKKAKLKAWLLEHKMPADGGPTRP